MAWRFRKSIKLFPGARLNLGKKGVSVRVGGKAFGYTTGTSGQRISGGIAGTGLSYSKQISGRHDNQTRSIGWLTFILRAFVLLIICAFGIAVLIALFTAKSGAQVAMGPAPAGEAATVAQRIIHDNFDKAVCPLVVKADRFGDGSIRARCSNNETFRVFSIPKAGNVAMKCSAATKLGISGC